MKKITLLNKEKLVHQIKFSIRILLIDLLLLAIILSFTTRASSEWGNLGSFITVILMVLFFYLIVKTFFDLYRIFFHKAYITNKRLLYVKGFFGAIKTYDIKDIIGVYIKSNIFDRGKNMTTFKIKTNDEKEIVLKNIKYGAHVAPLLSEHLLKMHKNRELKQEKE